MELRFTRYVMFLKRSIIMDYVVWRGDTITTRMDAHESCISRQTHMKAVFPGNRRVWLLIREEWYITKHAHILCFLTIDVCGKSLMSHMWPQHCCTLALYIVDVGSGVIRPRNTSGCITLRPHHDVPFGRVMVCVARRTGCMANTYCLCL